MAGWRRQRQVPACPDHLLYAARDSLSKSVPAELVSQVRRIFHGSRSRRLRRNHGHIGLLAVAAPLGCVEMSLRRRRAEGYDVALVEIQHRSAEEGRECFLIELVEGTRILAVVHRALGLLGVVISECDLCEEASHPDAWGMKYRSKGCRRRKCSLRRDEHHGLAAATDGGTLDRL